MNTERQRDRSKSKNPIVATLKTSRSSSRNRVASKERSTTLSMKRKPSVKKEVLPPSVVKENICPNEEPEEMVYEENTKQVPMIY